MKGIKSLLIMLLPLCAYTQTIQNGNFENWNEVKYDDPAKGWFNSNPQSIERTGKSTCFKSNDAHGGNNAVKLVTVAGPNDNSAGYIINTNPVGGKGGPPTLGGVPYNTLPTKITGWYKYSTINTDTAFILVTIKKGGAVLTQDIFNIVASSVYKQFTFTLSSNSTIPDTVIIAVASTTMILHNGKNAPQGSTLYIDDLAFLGSGTMPAIPDGDFESSWSTASFALLTGWSQQSDPGRITRTTDHFKGAYAIQLMNSQNDKGEGFPSRISNSKNPNNWQVGGAAYSNKVDTLIGFYKYTSVGGDSGWVTATFSKNGSFMNSFSTYLLTASTFTEFKIPISLSTSPDTVRIDVQSAKTNNNGMGAHFGSTLILDEIQFSSSPLTTGIEESNEFFSAAVAYPNPANENIRITPSKDVQGKACLSVFNALGELVFKREEVDALGVEISLLGFLRGTYWYRINTANGTSTGSFMKR